MFHASSTNSAVSEFRLRTIPVLEKLPDRAMYKSLGLEQLVHMGVQAIAGYVRVEIFDAAFRKRKKRYSDTDFAVIKTLEEAWNRYKELLSREAHGTAAGTRNLR